MEITIRSDVVDSYGVILDHIARGKIIFNTISFKLKTVNLLWSVDMTENDLVDTVFP